MTPLDWLNAFLSIPGLIASVLLQFWLPVAVLAIVAMVAYGAYDAFRQGRSKQR